MKKELDYEGLEQGKFTAFQEMIHVLRGKDGCPWDRVQTFESLKPCMIDELSEAIAGIDIYQESGEAENLCEELGDVLLHIVLLADMAEEAGLFSMEDITRGIGRKMLRRHPHVFEEDARRGYAPEDLEGVEELPQTWDEIKAIEKRKIRPEQKQMAAEKLANAKQEICSQLSV